MLGIMIRKRPIRRSVTAVCIPVNRHHREEPLVATSSCRVGGGMWRASGSSGDTRPDRTGRKGRRTRPDDPDSNKPRSLSKDGQWPQEQHGCRESTPDGLMRARCQGRTHRRHRLHTGENGIGAGQCYKGDYSYGQFCNDI